MSALRRSSWDPPAFARQLEAAYRAIWCYRAERTGAKRVAVAVDPPR